MKKYKNLMVDMFPHEPEFYKWLQIQKKGGRR